MVRQKGIAMCKTCKVMHSPPRGKDCKNRPKTRSSAKNNPEPRAQPKTKAKKNLSKELEKAQNDAKKKKDRIVDGQPLMSAQQVEEFLKKTTDEIERKNKAEVDKLQKEINDLKMATPNPKKNSEPPKPSSDDEESDEDDTTQATTPPKKKKSSDPIQNLPIELQLVLAKALKDIEDGKEKKTQKKQKPAERPAGWSKKTSDDYDGSEAGNSDSRKRGHRNDDDYDSEPEAEKKKPKKKSALERTGASAVKYDIDVPHFLVYRNNVAVRFEHQRIEEFGWAFNKWRNEPGRTDTDKVALDYIFSEVMEEARNTTWTEAKTLFGELTRHVERGEFHWDDTDKIRHFFASTRLQRLQQRAFQFRPQTPAPTTSYSKPAQEQSPRIRVNGKMPCFAYNGGKCHKPDGHEDKGNHLSHVCIPCLHQQREERHPAIACPYKKRDQSSKPAAQGAPPTNSAPKNLPAPPPKK